DGCGGVAPARRRGPATRARGPRGDAHLRHPAREERRLAAAPAAPLRDPRLDRLRGRRAAGGAAHRGGRGRDARREAGAAAAAAGAPARRGRGRRQRRRLQAPRRRDRRRRARRRRPRRLRGAARLAAGARPRRGRAALRGRERPHLARRRTPAAARPRRPRAVSRHRARQGGALRRGAAGGAPGARRPVTADRFVALFPLWLLIGAAAALAHPPLLVWFLERGLVTPGLAVIMLGMGLTLEADDFARVLRRPAPVVLGLALQYGVMPAAGLAAAELWDLPRAFAAGVILVCCCPGGTASNVVTYLARGDVPLSVSMTAVSTLCAPLATPLLATWLIGDRVEVDPLGLVRDTLAVVLLPVATGVALRRFAPRLTAALLPFAPPAATLMIVLIV